MQIFIHESNDLWGSCTKSVYVNWVVLSNKITKSIYSRKYKESWNIVANIAKLWIATYLFIPIIFFFYMSSHCLIHHSNFSFWEFPVEGWVSVNPILLKQLKCHPGPAGSSLDGPNCGRAHNLCYYGLRRSNFNCIVILSQGCHLHSMPWKRGCFSGRLYCPKKTGISLMNKKPFWIMTLDFLLHKENKII